MLSVPVPVLGGDWPDPSFIRDGQGYAAVTTSGGWAPSFRILRSDDLSAWRITGSVFRRSPRWARGALWAPELTRLNGRYAVFYSAAARRKGTGYCLGVATAPAAAGPYRDRGRPLRCGRYGSIDPYAVRDEKGRLHLLWKEDGNAFNRPSRILAQRLSEDGRRLRGRPHALIRNRAGWERRVVEAPSVIRRNGYFYLFYSGNLCCTENCAYAVGVARSARLLGRWRKYPANPILRDGNGWRCPGHASVVPDPAGGYKALFHAYREKAGLLIGRQLLVDEVTFGSDGWPRIGAGIPAPVATGAPSTAFSDDFAGSSLAPEWEWPLGRVPGIRVGDGLRLRAPRTSRRRVDGGVLSRRVGTDRYSAAAIVDRGELAGRELAGLGSFQSPRVAIGVAVGTRRLIVWQRRKGRHRVLAQTTPPAGPLLHLRLTAHWRSIRFEYSADGATWFPIGGAWKTPVEESARLVLTVGGRKRAGARFTRAMLTDTGLPPDYVLPAPRR